MPEPTVFIVDDDRGVRNSIRELVESVGLTAQVFESAQAYLASFEPAHPGCLVLDVRMAHMSGLTLQARLNEINASIPIVFVSAHGDISMAVSAIKHGAIDFVQKPYREQQLLDAINEALARDAEIRGVSDAKTATKLCELTPREREIVELALKGKSCKSIGNHLGISYRTVELHRSNALEKLGVKTIMELAFDIINTRVNGNAPEKT